nr:MAG TPA: hypothetical protein [Caudoviricetes sp.]
MERLTEKHYLGTDHYMKCSGGCNVDMDCIDCPSFDCLVERLAAYEDTGLTPEEVLPKDKADEIALKLMRLADLESFCSYTRLRALAEADKDGRLVVPPCKVGDKLYRVFAGEIFEHRVGSMKYFAIQGKWDIETYPFCPCVESSIGKTIFLTREKAKAALEAMKDE